MGIPDSDLGKLRTAAVKAVVRMSPGQISAATLRALAASGKLELLDSAIGHHRQVICEWASCVWDGLPDLSMMQICLEAAVAKLRQLSKPWRGVIDPAGVFILTLGRIGWSAASARHLLADQGMSLDLCRRHLSP